MMYGRITALVVLVALVGSAHAQTGKCNGLDACTCQYDDGTILSLDGVSRTDGIPNFANVSDATGDLFFWNPCKSFSINANGSECQNVAVCMMRQTIPHESYYDLGGEDSAVFGTDENGTLTVTYTADKGDYQRSTVVTLQCMEKSHFDFFVAEGEQESSNNTVIVYKMVLASKHACGYGPHLIPATQDASLSGGVIFVIVLFSLIGAYIVFGVSFQFFVKKESGKRLCPNHEFWCNIPSCVTGGCKSTTSITTSDKGAKYDSI